MAPAGVGSCSRLSDSRGNGAHKWDTGGISAKFTTAPGRKAGRKGQTCARLEETLLTAERAQRRWGLDDLEFSPDGTRVAFSVQSPIEGPEAVWDIWVLNAASSNLRQFTFSASNNRQPHWSPETERLAFLSDRSGSMQIHWLRPQGGEATQLTYCPTAVESFAWSPDGRRIAFVAPEPREEEEQRREEELVRLMGMHFYNHDKPLQLWVVDVESGKTRRLTSSPWRIAHSYWAPNFVWGPKGEFLYVSAADDSHFELLSNRICTVRVSDGAIREFARPPGGFGKLRLSPDKKTLSYLGPREDAFESDDLYLQPLSGGVRRNLTGASIDRRLWEYEWLADGRIMVQALSGFHSRFFICSQDGQAEEFEGFDVPASGHYGYAKPFAATSDRLVFVGERASVAAELWVSSAPGQAKRVSNFNREWDDIPVTPMEIIRYPSFDGLEIEAGLLKPAGYQEGTRVPLVMLVHGGPSAKFSDRFRWWAQMLPSHGIAVLCPNVRGSTGYGYEFLVANRYDWGGGDYRDVMAGVDYMIEQGIADPERLGIGGWSYGGYMSAWAITQTTRFKAAVIGAPMTNLVSEFGTEERWASNYFTWYFGTPYESLDLFIQRSPITHVRNVRTPALLMNGESDDNTPLGQSLEFYRGLKRYGVESELAVYTGAGHFPRDSVPQQIDLHRRFVGWLVEHLKGAGTD